MPKLMWKGLIATFITALLLLVPGRVEAEEPEPGWQAAKQVRQALFEAQVALQQKNTAAARAHFLKAAAAFDRTLAPVLAEEAPEVYALLRAQFERAGTAVEQNDPVRLAEARGRIGSGLLLAGYRLTVRAVEQNRPDLARTWLLLRAYRPSTRFSRPGADATLAVNAWPAGQAPGEKTLTAIQADLLDTYQAELIKSLDTILEAGEKGLPIRRAEAVGQAQGYWLFLQPAYAAQFGPAAGQKLDAAFRALSGVDGPQKLAPAIAGIQEELHAFRAAPLSEEEQARRAGQLLRFLTLVPVEYGRGVRNGQVFLDLEVQEAVTFLEGARAAFDDLRLPLQTLDAGRATTIAALLDQTEHHLQEANQDRAVVEPEVIERDIDSALAHLRAVLPEKWQQANSGADFDVVASVLDRMEAAVAAGQYQQAETARLEVYALFDFGPELRLLAFAPDLVAQVDGLFWHGHGSEPGLAAVIANQASPAEIKAVRARLDEALGRSQRILGDGTSAPTAIIFNAAVIVFREGLEAVVILAALMASLVGAYASYRKPMIVGAVLALAVTALTWVVAQQILLALGRFGEKLEAVVSLIAIGVLLLITNWFFHKVYWKDWLKSFHSQKKRILLGQASQFAGLMVLGFTSIYREGFETVLFLQALVLDAGLLTVLQGVAMGSLGVILVGLLTFKLQRKLPYRQMLVITGILIGGVLLVMVGNTLHVLQAVNWLTITPVAGLSLPYWLGLWFGLFPTWEGIAGQAAAALFVIGSYYLAEHTTRRNRYTQASQKTGLESIS